jgi:hypothetical protein
MSHPISRPTLPSPTPPPAARPPALSSGQAILPAQLWASLTPDQQVTVVRTMIAVGRQLVQHVRPPTPRPTEVSHD